MSSDEITSADLLYIADLLLAVSKADAEWPALSEQTKSELLECLVATEAALRRAVLEAQLSAVRH